MKITYIQESCAYHVELNNQEIDIWLNTNDIAEAREYFLDHMRWLFNNAICEQLKE